MKSRTIFVVNCDLNLCLKGIIIDPIFFGQTTNNNLVVLSSNTCGHLMASNLECNLNLIEAFKGLSETNNGDNFNKVFQVGLHF